MLPSAARDPERGPFKVIGSLWASLAAAGLLAAGPCGLRRAPARPRLRRRLPRRRRVAAPSAARSGPLRRSVDPERRHLRSRPAVHGHGYPVPGHARHRRRPRHSSSRRRHHRGGPGLLRLLCDHLPGQPRLPTSGCPRSPGGASCPRPGALRAFRCWALGAWPSGNAGRSPTCGSPRSGRPCRQRCRSMRQRREPVAAAVPAVQPGVLERGRARAEARQLRHVLRRPGVPVDPADPESLAPAWPVAVKTVLSRAAWPLGVVSKPSCPLLGILPWAAVHVSSVNQIFFASVPAPAHLPAQQRGHLERLGRRSHARSGAAEKKWTDTASKSPWLPPCRAAHLAPWGRAAHAGEAAQHHRRRRDRRDGRPVARPAAGAVAGGPGPGGPEEVGRRLVPDLPVTHRHPGRTGASPEGALGPVAPDQRRHEVRVELRIRWGRTGAPRRGSDGFVDAHTRGAEHDRQHVQAAAQPPRDDAVGLAAKS